MASSTPISPMTMASPPSPNLQTNTTTTLLTLPPELRRQIYTHAFSNLTLHPFAPQSSSSTPDCQRCHQHSLSTPLPGSLPSSTSPFLLTPHLFRTHFTPLLTCRQFYTEASPIFYATLCLKLTSFTTLDFILHKTPQGLRHKVRAVDVTVHLDDNTRSYWHASLCHLHPATFPELKTLTVHNHMRSPTSYDRLVDCIYLCAPLVTMPEAFGTVAKSSAAESDHDNDNDSDDDKGTDEGGYEDTDALALKFAYQRDEIMFESPFLGEITTEDSIDAHEAVVRDLMADGPFRVASERGSEDWDTMTARLLFVARGHEERWLEGLQRRRLGAGMSFREVSERVGEPLGVGLDGTGEGVDVDLDSEDEDEGVWEE